MIRGKETLVLRHAPPITVEYQFGGNYDDTWSGYLVFDVRSYDPAVFVDRLTLDCEDGTRVTMATMNISDRHLSVNGRVVSSKIADKNKSPEVY